MIGHGQPFFAPIAAVVSLSASVGQRGTRAVQMMLGVTLGIVVADAAVELLGASALVVSLVVLLSMWLALLATNGIMFVNQAGASAILVTTLHQPGIGGVRLIDALVGGVTALLFSQVLFPPDPVGVLLRAARDVLSVCASALDRVVAAVHEERESGDEDDEEPEWALEIARDVHDSLAALADARSTSFQIARLTRRRTVRPRLVAVGRRVARLDLVANAVLSMTRSTARMMATDPERVPDWLEQRARDLAEALRGLAEHPEPGREERRRLRSVAEEALAAAEQPLRDGAGPSAQLVAGPVRAVARDLLELLDEEQVQREQPPTPLRSRLARLPRTE